MLVVPEPDNQFDSNAIAVHAEGFGKVGYFARGDALEWKTVAEALIYWQAVGACEGWLRGGTSGKSNIGVWLSIKDADKLEEEFGLAAGD